MCYIHCGMVLSFFLTRFEGQEINLAPAGSNPPPNDQESSHQTNSVAILYSLLDSSFEGLGKLAKKKDDSPKDDIYIESDH